MPLETANYISELNVSNPAPSDGLNQTDDHIRLIKSALDNTFPNFTAGALDATQDEVDAAVTAVAEGTVKLASGSVGSPGIVFKDDPDTGFSNPTPNTIKGSVGAVEFMAVAEDKSVTFAGKVSAAALAGPGTMPVGATCVWWTDTLPDETLWGRYAWANGGTLSRADNPALFALWGVTYGAGNGTTTFNVPDMRDNVPVGKGTMGGAAAVGRITAGVTGFVTSTLGAIFGACLHVLSIGEMPAHKHTATSTHNLPANIVIGVGLTVAGEGSTITSGLQSWETLHIDTALADTGGGTSHSNVQPSIVCNWIIKLG